MCDRRQRGSGALHSNALFAPDDAELLVTRIGGWSDVQYNTHVESAALGAWCMPSVVDPSSSDFPVFPPVRRRSRGVGAVGAVSAIPLPPRHEFPQFPLVRYPPPGAATAAPGAK